MKVILLKDILNLGEENELVEVSEGFARNYLLPKKSAIVATSYAIAALERNKKNIAKKLEEKKAGFRETAKKLEGKALEIKVDVGEEGKLFGSVSTVDIAGAIKAAYGVDVDRKKIVLSEHIKALGEYPVSVKMFSGVEAKITVQVVPSN